MKKHLGVVDVKFQFNEGAVLFYKGDDGKWLGKVSLISG